MPSELFLHVVPDGPTSAQLIDRVLAAGGWHDGGETTLTRTYYDSFDWRLYRAGGLLIGERTAPRRPRNRQPSVPDSDTLLRWQRCADGAVLGRCRPDGAPRTVDALPAGPLRDRLTPLLRPRALLAQASVAVCRRTLEQRNEDGKLVLRLVLESATRADQPAFRYDLLRLVPVRGYRRAPARVLALLERERGLTAARPDALLQAALAAERRRPGDYCGKLDLTLDRDQPADAALRQVLQRLLAMLQANEAGTRDDLDSEFLHDFRVAVRRTRSALGQLRAALPDALAEEFRPAFRWFGQITGPVRDLDVLIEQFDDYRAMLPPAQRDSLEPLLGHLHAQRRQAQRQLRRKLGSARYRRLLRGWRRALDAPWPTPGAAGALGPFADARIWRACRKVRRQGRAIGPQTPAEALHELRKSGKKLRYLMEFFENLYPAEAIAASIKQLKRLQDNLGEFQNLEVHAQLLGHHARAFAERGAAPADTLIATGRVIAELERRQRRARDDFAERFAVFDSADNRRRYRALFRCRPQAE